MGLRGTVQPCVHNPDRTALRLLGPGQETAPAAGEPAVRECNQLESDIKHIKHATLQHRMLSFKPDA